MSSEYFFACVMLLPAVALNLVVDEFFQQLVSQVPLFHTREARQKLGIKNRNRFVFHLKQVYYAVGMDDVLFE